MDIGRQNGDANSEKHMKPLKWITVIAALLSLILALYGCIKLARFEDKANFPIKIDIPNVTVVPMTNDADRDYVKRIVALSLSIFLASLIGFGTLAWMQKKKKPPSGNIEGERPDEFEKMAAVRYYRVEVYEGAQSRLAYFCEITGGLFKLQYGWGKYTRQMHSTLADAIDDFRKYLQYEHNVAKDGIKIALGEPVEVEWGEVKENSPARE